MKLLTLFMMRLSDFDYHLPEELIAHTPAKERTDARLMVVNRRLGTITHSTFAKLPEFLPADTTLVFNRSKVLHARLRIVGEGSDQELFLVKEYTPGTWQCLVRPGKKFKAGQAYEKTIESPQGARTTLRLHVEEGPEGTRLITFGVDDVYALLDTYGHLPLPPYISAQDSAELRARYQTVYAQEQGSVAAPTAGLHFTHTLLDTLEAQGFHQETVLLHVGLGTFQPVKVEELKDHVMHSEWYHIDAATAARLTERKAAGKPILAVGTTATRVLESVSSNGMVHAGSGDTDIFITPGYNFQCIDHLITNFHLPKSTLLMLVSAFAGTELITRAYAEAIAEQYRFYSFGDGMLIL